MTVGPSRGRRSRDARAGAGIAGIAGPELLPLDAGEQYRFGFAMDACIGCHSLRGGLRRAERPARRHRVAAGRRDRGRRPSRRPRRFHLSMACNHCLEPACLEGCPTNAYEKLANGVVAHHADDCIGCQYCTWNCPYSVPAFQPDRRIVTKCDMCLPRLEDGLRRRRASTACPTHAITVEKVDVAAWRADHARGRRPAAAERRPHAVDHPHRAARRRARSRRSRPATGTCGPSTRTGRSCGSPCSASSRVGVERHRVDRRRTGCVAAVARGGRAGRRRCCHLGRPAMAWKALRNLRRSWLSREVALLRRLRRARRAPPSLVPPAGAGRGRGRRRRRRVRVGAGSTSCPAAGVEHAAHARRASSPPRLAARPAASTGQPRLAARRRRPSPLARDRGQLGAAGRRPRPPWLAAPSASSCGWFRAVDRRCAWRSAPARSRCSRPARPGAGRARRSLAARRADRPLALLRHRRAAQHARLVLARRTREPPVSARSARPSGRSASTTAATATRTSTTRCSGPVSAQPAAGAVGAHDLRLLLGRLRDAARRPRRPGRRRAGRPRPPGEPRAACARRACPSTTRSTRAGPAHHARRVRRPAGRRGTTRSTAMVDGFRALLDRARARVGRRALAPASS